MGGRVDGWKEAKAGLRIAYSNQQSCPERDLKRQAIIKTTLPCHSQKAAKMLRKNEILTAVLSNTKLLFETKYIFANKRRQQKLYKNKILIIKIGWQEA